MATYGKVMLIDDDSIINLLNERMIQTTNFASEVKVYSRAAVALEEFKSISSADNSVTVPEIIFLDINMPDMDGWEFLDELLTIPFPVISNCKVIMLSSSINASDIEKSVTYPLVADFISKPLTPEKLKSISRKEKLNFLFEGND